MYEIAVIPFRATSGFISVRETTTGEVYVFPKSVCNLFGIEWKAQQQKLAENPQRWGYRIISITLPGDDRERSHAILPDRKVRSWICGINTEKVACEIREPLIVQHVLTENRISITW